MKLSRIFQGRGLIAGLSSSLKINWLYDSGTFQDRYEPCISQNGLSQTNLNELDELMVLRSVEKFTVEIWPFMSSLLRATHKHPHLHQQQSVLPTRRHASTGTVSVCLCLTQVNVLSKRVKFSHTRYWALGPELFPAYMQSDHRWREVNHAIDLAVGKVRQSETDVLPLCHATNCQNGWTNRAGFWPGSFFPHTVHCVIRKFRYLQK